MKTFIVGCGGVGSWLVPKLIRLTNPRDLVLLDGDILERKNLDRQLFEASQIGLNKAVALAQEYDIHPENALPEYLSPGSLEVSRRDLVICCADNHAARKECLAIADRHGCRTIIGANEFTDAEAYWYEPSFEGTPNDPRVLYPSILTDESEDPTRPESCQGDQAIRHPQLGLANDWASALITQLVWFLYHSPERKDIPRPYWPVHSRVNALGCRTTKLGDRTAAE